MKRGIIIGILIFVNSILFGQYKIEVKIKNLPNAQIILGHYKDTKLIPYDTAQTNNNGYAVFKGKKKLTKGLYFIYLPNRTYFEFLVGDDQTMYIETDTTDLYKNLKIEGSIDNQIFREYQNYMASHSDEIKKLEEKYKEAKTEKQKEKIRKQIEKLKKDWENYIMNIVQQYPDLFVSKFLKAMIDVKLPDTIKDPLKKYLWLKQHYFDNFDISDISMLYTPFFTKKVDYYLDKVILQHPDSLIAAVDYILDKTRNNDELYKFTLIHLFNKYARSRLVIAENVYVHLAEIYIRDAYWSDKKFINKLKTRIAKKKNCLIGMKAHNFGLFVLPNDSVKIEELKAGPLEDLKQRGLEIEKEKPNFDDRIDDLSLLIQQFLSTFPYYIELDKIQAKYIVLWFWDPECSHCQRETPQLYKIFTKDLQDKGVVVLAIYLERNTDDWARFSNHIKKWLNFIENHHFYAKGWINGWNPFANVRFYYDINATPTVYVLDKDKKIIAKHIGPEQIKDLILDMEKHEQDNNQKNK